MRLVLALAVCAVLREATGATQPTLVTVTFPERALGVSIEADEDGPVYVTSVKTFSAAWGRVLAGDVVASVAGVAVPKPSPQTLRAAASQTVAARHPTDRAPATEDADRVGRSVGARSACGRLREHVSPSAHVTAP